MQKDNEKLDAILAEISPVILQPADYPPAVIVRDTARDELQQRITANAEKVDLTLTDEHWEVINTLFDFYTYCCEAAETKYGKMQDYWDYVDCILEPTCKDKRHYPHQDHTEQCPFGQLSVKESLQAYRVYRMLTKAFVDKGGKKHLYKLFPYGPVFTIHLLAQLPRLNHDVDPHFGTAY